MAVESHNADSNSALPAKPPIWNDPKYRALFFQAVVLFAVVALGVYLTNNAANNLAKSGIASGFDFLKSTAGFSISMVLIEWSEEMSYGRAFVIAFLNTILVSIIGIFFATILGFIIGVARLSRNWVISNMAAVYIEVFRNIPLLLQIFFWYFAMLRPLPAPRDSVSVFGSFFLNNRGLFMPRPEFLSGFGVVAILFVLGVVGAVVLSRWARRRQEATGQLFPAFRAGLGLILVPPLIAYFVLGSPLSWGMPVLKGFNFQGGTQLIPEFVALIVALSVYTASFIAEIVRAGILAVSHGQTEASYSLGIKPSWTLRLIIVPQALRVIIPPLTSQYLNLMKNSSLAAAIAYPDLVLVFAGTVLMQTGQAVEVIALTMAVYLSLSLLISAFMNWYNKRMALVER